MRRSAHEVLLFQPRGGEAVRSLRVRGHVLARVAAKKLLVPHAVTTTRGCYHRDVARSWWALVIRPDGQRETIGPAVSIVPSVGELGWW